MKIKGSVFLAAFLMLWLVFLYNNCNGWDVQKAINESASVDDPNASQDPLPNPNPPPAGTTLSEKAMNLLAMQCGICHGPAVKSGTIPFDVTSWENMVTTTKVVVPNNLAGSVLYARMVQTTAPMPTTGTLPADQLKIIADWINAGALKPGAGTPPPVVETFDPLKTAKTYVNVKKFILDRSCVGCHGPDGAKGGVRFDTYAETLRDLSGLVSEIQNDSMPPKKDRASYPAVNAVELKFIKDWVALGAPEK